MNSPQFEGLIPDKETYFFLHIPKTAGTSFVSFLDNLFHRQEICPAYYTFELAKIAPVQLNNYRLFQGHINYYALCQSIGKKPKTLTFVRNPFEHAISFFYHLKRITDRQYLDVFIDPVKQMSLEDYMYNAGHAHDSDYRNLQIRKLTTKLRYKNFQRGEDQSFSVIPDSSNLSDLEYAQKLLTDFMFVGISERFEDSLFLLCYLLGLRPLANIPYLNTGTNKPHLEQISSDIYDEIARNNALDIELYNFAQQLFEQRFTSMCEDLLERYASPELARIKLPLPKEVIHELLEKHYQAKFKEKNNPVTSLYYRLDQPLSGEGWYIRENDANYGVFRWSGPGTISTIDFPLAAGSDLLIQVEALNAIITEVVESLELDVNGQPIPLTYKYSDVGTITYEGIIKVSALQKHPGLATLSFKVKQTINPRSIDPTTIDERYLGIALTRIEITPLNT